MNLPEAITRGAGPARGVSQRHPLAIVALAVLVTSAAGQAVRSEDESLSKAFTQLRGVGCKNASHISLSHR
jgi:hypothetical protein